MKESASGFICPTNEDITDLQLFGRAAPRDSSHWRLFDKGHVLQSFSQEFFAAEVVMDMNKIIPKRFKLASAYQLQANRGHLFQKTRNR